MSEIMQIIPKEETLRRFPDSLAIKVLLGCYHKNTRYELRRDGTCSPGRGFRSGRVLTVKHWRRCCCCFCCCCCCSQNQTQSRRCLCSDSCSSHFPDSLWQAGSLPQELCFTSHSHSSPQENWGERLRLRSGSRGRIIIKIRKKTGKSA